MSIEEEYEAYDAQKPEQERIKELADFVAYCVIEYSKTHHPELKDGFRW